MKKGLFLFMLCSMVACHTGNQQIFEIQDQSNKISNASDSFISDLMDKMTLDEKIGQMTLFTSDWDVTGPVIKANYEADIKSGKVGSIFNAHTAAYTRKLQKIAIEETRLGIPLLFGYDVIHGYRTIFPISLGESSSWDLEAIENASRIAAKEAASAGLHWTFAPMVDIARDPRWGRISEGAGEDTYLGSEIAKARVKGIQGKDLNNVNTIAACAKHFAAYGAAQAGRDYHTVDISDRVLRETYLPPFKAAIDAGVRTFMTSFNELNGVPVSASKYLMTDILRDEWGFDGFVVTDYTSINEMVEHGSATDFKDAGKQSILAGIDMDMQGAVFYNHLKTLYNEGKVSMVSINQAVRRVLLIKYELGLFEDPYKYSNEAREKNTIMNIEHLNAARDLARKSFVLLENKNNTLPFSNDINTIAVIGPLADSKVDMLGSWHAHGSAEDCITVLEGIKARFPTNVDIHYAKTCDVMSEELNKKELKDAITIVNKSDVVVLVIGEHAWQSGEAASRTDIGIPGVQLDLAKAIIATGKPVAVVLMNGRPLTLPWLSENAPALLETWFSGTQGGHAIADVLFGDYNPSGKLVTTFPRKVGQIPIHYNMKRTGRPLNPTFKYTTKYLDCENSPQYPFGYGLSYTNFEYKNLSVDKNEFTSNQSVTISCAIKNIGNREGTEIVQLYLKDVFSSATRPSRELKAFKKVHLKAGEQQVVQFELSNKDFAFYTRDMTFKAEPGDFEIFVGGDSNAEKMVKVSLK